MTTDALTDTIERGARSALTTILGAHPGENLIGFALCTDDDLWTLYAAATTHEAGLTPEEQFVPVDWPYEESSPFREASGLLKNRPIGSDYDAYFRTITRALQRMRDQSVFAPTTFLAVLSTDPGPIQRRLAREAILTLNSPEVAEAALGVLRL